MHISQGTLLAQGLTDFLELYHYKEVDKAESTCCITIPFEMKTDFAEDVLTLKEVKFDCIFSVYVQQSATLLPGPRAGVCTIYLGETHRRRRETHLLLANQP